MCRLLGYAAPRATTAQALLGGADAREWQRMGRLHADGWGTAWLDAAGDVRRLRDPGTGATSPDLAGAIAEGATRARIAHLRLATQGLGVGPGNTHPFVADGIAFAHNGSIQPLHELRAMVRQDEIDRIGASTDSAIVAALVLREVRRGVPLLEATTGTVARLRERFPTSAINLLVLSSDELVAVHANEGAPVPLAFFDASGLGADLPRDHVEHYYRLSWRREADGAVAVTSSGLASEGWQPMRQHSALRVDLATLALDVVDLPGDARAAA